jgi:ATP-binding cassette subfamily B protein
VRTRRRANVEEGAAAPDELAEDDLGPDPDYEATDPLDFMIEARNQPKSFLGLFRLGADALRLTWRAGRGVLLLNLVVSLGAAAVGGIQVLLVQRLLGRLFGSGSGDEALSKALPIVGILLGIAAFTTVARSLAPLTQRLLGTLVSQATTRQLLDVSTNVDLSFYETSNFYNHLQRVKANSLSRPLTIVSGLVGILAGLVGSLTVVAAVVTIEPLLLPALLFAGLPLVIANRMVSRLEFTFAVDQTPTLRERLYLEETLTDRNSAKEVRAFAVGDHLRDRWAASYDAYVRSLRYLIKERFIMLLAGTAASGLLALLVLALLVYMVREGMVSVTDGIAVLYAVRLLSSRVQQTAGAAATLYESGLFLADMRRFLELRPPQDHVTGEAAQVPDLDELSTEQLTFQYPGASTPALRGVDFTIRRGEVVALVGENGSGKTTLAKLVAGLYSATEGRVTWNGVDVADLDLVAMRQRVAIIFQDFVKYQLSARDNIVLGDVANRSDEARMREAARQVGVDGFLEGLPRGYATYLSTAFGGGVDLSGGQWQRVALARAFFRDAPFVILDEPTSALDPRAEHQLFQTIRTLLAGRTVLLITHRFSSARAADRICVMEAGQIVESGRHEDLMREEGLYAELYELQAKAFHGPVGRQA